MQVCAIVTTEDGVRIKVEAVDISSDGLGVECNTRQRNMITPGGSFLREGRPVSVFIDMSLSDEDGLSSKIEARCNVVFSRRMSSDQCKIGLRYTEIKGNSHEWLVQFIDKASASRQRINNESGDN